MNFSQSTANKQTTFHWSYLSFSLCTSNFGDRLLRFGESDGKLLLDRRQGMDRGALETPFNFTTFITCSLRLSARDLHDFSLQWQARLNPFLLHISLSVDNVWREESGVESSSSFSPMPPTPAILCTLPVTSHKYVHKSVTTSLSQGFPRTGKSCQCCLSEWFLQDLSLYSQNFE